MSETPQESYDVARTVTRIVKPGTQAQAFLKRVFEDVSRMVQSAGPDGLITVTITSHVPSRRLPEHATGDATE